MLALISTDVLKLRRRRGMLAISLLLTAGLMAVAFVVMVIQHGGNPARYGPAGGVSNYHDDIAVVTLMALIVGSIIGATSGTQDIESGVFRDLAATGRSRMALFAYVHAFPEDLHIPVLVAGVALHGVCFGCFLFLAFMIVDEETSADVELIDYQMVDASGVERASDDRPVLITVRVPST